MKINVRGVSAVIKEIETKVNDEKSRKKTIVTHELVTALKAATPVDTGNARDSWEINNGSIVNTADYISDLNAGSSQQAPTHFIEKTVLENKEVRPDGFIVKYSSIPAD